MPSVPVRKRKDRAPLPAGNFPYMVLLVLFYLSPILLVVPSLSAAAFTSVGLEPAPNAPANLRRPLPNGSGRLLPWTDQIASGQTHAVATPFAATHYIGTQKCSRSSADAYRASNPNFLILQYHLCFGLTRAGNFQSDGNWSNDDIATFNARVPLNQRANYYQTSTKATNATFNPNNWVSQFASQGCSGDFWMFNVMPTGGGTQPGYGTQYMRDLLVERQLALDNDSVWLDTGYPPSFGYLPADWYIDPALFGTQNLTTQFPGWWNPIASKHFQTLRTAFSDPSHPRWLVLPNAGNVYTTWYDPAFLTSTDGLVMEGFIKGGSNTPVQMTAPVDFVLSFQRIAQYLTGNGVNKVLYAYVGMSSDNIAARESYAAAFLIMSNELSYYWLAMAIGSQPGGTPSPWPLWYPEYELDLGSATIPVDTNINNHKHSSNANVYWRDFQHGMAFINASAAAQTVTLPAGTYYRVEFSGGGYVSGTGVLPTMMLRAITAVSGNVSIPAGGGLILSKSSFADGARPLYTRTVTNTAPTIASSVTASPNPVVNANSTALNVTASDADQKPAVLTYTWAKTTGPGTVTFSQNGTWTSNAPVACFSASGTYTLQVTVSDGRATTNGSITLNVTLPGSPVRPTVNAGSDQSITLPANVTLTGSITDPDSLPITTWTKVSGPGAVVFADAGASSTTAGFTAPGSYVLQLTADDKITTPASDTLTVTVAASTGGGTAPSISVNPASTAVTVGATATFNVTASGTAPLAYQWQKNNVNIGGATASSYTTPATVIGDNGATFRVIVTNGSGTATSLSATLTVNAGSNPVTSTASTVTLNGTVGSTTPISTTFTLTNTSGGAISVTGSDSQAWITVSPSIATSISAGGTLVITVTADPSGLNGTYSGTVTITNSPGGQTRTLPVTFTVSAASAGGAGGGKRGCTVGGASSVSAAGAAGAWLPVLLLMALSCLARRRFRGA